LVGAPGTVDVAVDVVAAVSMGGANPKAESDARMTEATIAPRPEPLANDLP
jgi:hypothetical protein